MVSLCQDVYPLAHITPIYICVWNPCPNMYRRAQKQTRQEACLSCGNNPNVLMLLFLNPINFRGNTHHPAVFFHPTSCFEHNRPSRNT